MIRKDFIEKGFPVCKRAPIICITREGAIQPSYSRFELNKTLQSTPNRDDIVACFGVWPGKTNTDCFIINPEAYVRILPKEADANIDSAIEIGIEGETVSYKLDGTVQRVNDPDLRRYVEQNLQHRRIF